MKSLLLSLVSVAAMAFSTPDEAAKDALQAFAHKNDTHAVEYCVAIYKQGNEYQHTEIVKGQGNSVEIPFYLIPDDGQFVASVHNHPALGMDRPSVDDIRTTVLSSVGTKRTSTGFGTGYYSYLVLVTGQVLKYRIPTGVRFNQVKETTVEIEVMK